MANPVPVIVTFFDPANNPIAGGTVTFDLTVDISIAGSGQVCAGRQTSATLDATGSAIVNLWPTDTALVTSPSAAAAYIVTAYNAAGLQVWKGTLQVGNTVGQQYLLLEDGTPILLESGFPAAFLLESSS